LTGRAVRGRGYLQHRDGVFARRPEHDHRDLGAADDRALRDPPRWFRGPNLQGNGAQHVRHQVEGELPVAAGVVPAHHDGADERQGTGGS
jgi:hypothetical protein